MALFSQREEECEESTRLRAQTPAATEHGEYRRLYRVFPSLAADKTEDTRLGGYLGQES